MVLTLRPIKLLYFIHWSMFTNKKKNITYFEILKTWVKRVGELSWAQ